MVVPQSGHGARSDKVLEGVLLARGPRFALLADRPVWYDASSVLDRLYATVRALLGDEHASCQR
jgi:hypothetical protein